MRGLPGDTRIFDTRSMDAILMPLKGRDSRLVQRQPVVDTSLKVARDNLDILSKRVDRLSALPASQFILQRLGQIPVIQRRVWLNPSLQQAIHQAIVKIEAARIDFPSPGWYDTRPGNGELIEVYA